MEINFSAELTSLSFRINELLLETFFCTKFIETADILFTEK